MHINILIYIFAAIMEIAGCFSFWAWLKLGKSIFWIIPGILALCLFALALSYIDSEYAGRAYAAYGAIYIMSSIIWMWLIEKNTPDLFDIIGLVICLLGAFIILFGRKYSL